MQQDGSVLSLLVGEQVCGELVNRVVTFILSAAVLLRVGSSAARGSVPGTETAPSPDSAFHSFGPVQSVCVISQEDLR